MSNSAENLQIVLHDAALEAMRNYARLCNSAVELLTAATDYGEVLRRISPNASTDAWGLNRVLDILKGSVAEDLAHGEAFTDKLSAPVDSATR